MIPTTEAEVDLATDKFMAEHGAAISDLIRKVGDEALTKLHCMSLWGSPKVALRLRELIRKVARSRIAQGGELCDQCGDGSVLSKWGSDDIFLVTVDDVQETGAARKIRIRVGLCLAESKIAG